MVDLVILNGKLITFDGPDAEALAITGGIITAVGTTSEIRAIAGSARVIDAGGCTVLPGFIDSHVHFFGGSAHLDKLDLTDVQGADALKSAARAYAATRPADEMISGVACDYYLIDGCAPTRHDLDAALPDRPFLALAADHHTAWANTKALEMAGLLHGAPMPEGSEVIMGTDGTATGELRETGAFGPVMALSKLGGRELMGYITGADPIPAPTTDQRAADKAVMAEGMRHCASHGITTLHNMDGNFYQAELLSEMADDGTLLCRIEVPMHLKNTDSLNRLQEASEMRRRFTGDWVWSNRVKMFMDGVIDSRTAFMLENYPGTDSRSDPLFPPDHFAEACRRIDAENLQIAVHAIGDGAVCATLDGYEAARQANGPRDARHRIEHIETIHPDDLPRLAELGAVPSIQPLHSPAGGLFPPYAPGDLLHAHQIPYAFAHRKLRDTGVPMCYSTDWSVVPVDVMPSVKASVHHPEMPPEWSDQSLSLRETLACYIPNNAWVEFNETRKGKLSPGMMADVVVMDRDLEALDPIDLDKARAAITICGGRMTWEA